MDWWAHIDTSYAETMCEWLAEVDMELFLRIWQEYAQREEGLPCNACILTEHASCGAYSKRNLCEGHDFFWEQMQKLSCKNMSRPISPLHYSHI